MGAWASADHLNMRSFFPHFATHKHTVSKSMTDLPIDTNFKSTLPPRKRAKTKEEKEQRRVERILRNRRAAHASREKKRKHVEYLESYVLKLEQNLMDLQSNHDDMAAILTEDQRLRLSPRKLCDLSDLKDKIHSNLNSSVTLKKGKDDDLDDDDLEAEEEESEDNTPVIKTENVDSPESKNTKKEQPDNEHLQVSKKRRISEPENAIKDVYYNYLSPILINSPINSPIDLTLGKGSSNSYDLLGQNSEVILRYVPPGMKFVNTWLTSLCLLPC